MIIRRKVKRQEKKLKQKNIWRNRKSPKGIIMRERERETGRAAAGFRPIEPVRN